MHVGACVFTCLNIHACLCLHVPFYMCIYIHWRVLLCESPAPFPGAWLSADKDAILSRLKCTANGRDN